MLAVIEIAAALMLIAAILMLIIIAVVRFIGNIINNACDNRTMRKYQNEMNRLREERAWQEKEKQRKIRGEAEDAPKYAAGGEMDRINRNRWY